MLPRVMIAVLLLVTSAAAFTQPLPDVDALAGHVAAHVPPYWGITEFRVVAQDDVGDAARPRAVVRFEADAAPTADLFSHVDTIEPFMLVVPTLAVGASRVLYGLLELSYRAGAWSADVLLENPVAGLGQPADMFTKPTLVVGSNEAEALVAALHRQREAITVAEHERALAELTAAQDAALERLVSDHERTEQRLRAEHQDALTELTTTQDATIERLVSDHERTEQRLRAEQQHALASREQELRAELLALTDGLEPRVAEARRASSAALAEVEAAHAEALHSLRLEQEQQLEASRVAHAQQLAALRVRQAQEVAALEEELANEREQLLARIGASAEIIRLQQELVDNLAVQRDGATALLAAFNDIRTQRRNFFAALPTAWTGIIHCQDDQHGIDWQGPAGFEVREVSTNSINGRFSQVSSQLYTEWLQLVPTDSLLTIPMAFVASVTPSNRHLSRGEVRLVPPLAVTILENGTWIGLTRARFTRNNLELDVPCRIELGSQ